MSPNIGILRYEVLNKKLILSTIYITHENIYIKKRIPKKNIYALKAKTLF